MFSSYPLNQPTFFLQWQLHVVVVALFAIFGIWAGMTRRPWFVAPTLLVALLWLFVPLEAPEPAVVLLIGTAAVAVVCRLLRRWLMPQLGDQRWRFKLSDTLWLTFVVAFGAALLAQLVRQKWNQRFGWTNQDFAWLDLTLSGLCLAVLAAAMLAAYWQPTWRRRCLAGIAFVGLVIVAAFAHQAFLGSDFLMINSWDYMLNGIAGTLPNAITREEIFILYSASMLEFVGIVGLGLLMLWPIAILRPTWLRRGQQLVCAGALLACVVGLGVVYAEILKRAAWPEETFPATNGRDRMQQIAAEQNRINPSNNTVQGLQALGMTEDARRLEQLIDELDVLLQTEEITLFDSRTEVPEGSMLMGAFQDARGMARTLKSQAEIAWMTDQRKEALRHDMLCVRLGTAHQQRGIMIDSLVGVAIEGVAMHHLCVIHADLRCGETKALQTLLKDIAANREPLALTIARDKAWSEEAYGWRGRLELAAERLAGRDSWQIGAYDESFRRRDANLALLQTDLAIRCFRERHDRWPNDLRELADAEDATALPIDPFSGKPLIYRVEGDEFLLYSVGRNQVDDNGHFGTLSDQHQQGFDLDLDTYTRNSTPTATPAATTDPAEEESLMEEAEE